MPNASLPGLEDRKIEALQDAAIEYAAIRDKRQQLTSQEVELKAELLKLMKKYKKESYEFEGVKVEVVTEEETVKVRIAKKKEEEE